MNGTGRFGVLFFDDPLYIKIFLVVCLIILAFYLFFLQGKLFILWLKLANKFKRSGKIAVGPHQVASSIEPAPTTSIPQDPSSMTVASPNSFAKETASVEKEPVSVPSKSHQPILIDSGSKLPDSFDEKESSHMKEVVDRIKKRYRYAEKKIKLLKVLWIVLMILTAVYIITE